MVSTPTATPRHSSDPGRPTRATLSDVARLAGVSGKTVSRVISGSTNVSPATRERVLQAARRLRFSPNHLARDLRRGGVSTTVAFVMGDLSNPFYSGVAAGIEREVSKQGLTMVIAATEDDPGTETRVVKALLERRIRSLLLVPIAEDQSYLEGERQLGTPVVSVDRPAVNLAADSVVFDNEEGAAAAVRSLIAHGHRRIAFVGSSPTLYTHGRRLDGYRTAMREHSLAPRPQWERTEAVDTATAEEEVIALLDDPEPPTAVLAGNNRVTTGLLRGMRALGIGPDRLAFVGFDDFDLAEALGISVVAHDPFRMGVEAARLALAPADPESPPTRVVLPTRLILRGSGEHAPAGDGPVTRPG